MIVAGMPLSDAWSQHLLDVIQLNEAILVLILTTGTKELKSALDVLRDVA